MPTNICFISVISDVYTDQRIIRTAHCLQELNFKVHITGRKTKNTPQKTEQKFSFAISHINPLFRKGVGMYACFNLALLFKLLFLALKNKNCNILLYSNDLDTLLPNYIISKIFHLPIIYDAHELFTEVPELQNKKIKKKIWETLETFLVPKVSSAITVNQSIAKIYENKYKTKFHVVRNISEPIIVDKLKSRKELNLPTDKKIIILQGTGINIHRGAEELVQAMQYLDNNYLLLIIGGGDVIDTLKSMTKNLNLNDKIIFFNRMPPQQLYHYTANADIGISIDKPNNLNYLYSLPNKIFSYINAHIPVLSSRLPEIENIINHYQIGNFIDNHHPEHIAQKIKETIHHPQYMQWKQNTYIASEELNWNTEKEKLKKIITHYIYQ